MDRKIRVGAVSYLNTKPLLYGITRSALMNEIELITDYPSRIAAMLLADQIDVGLVPVAIIPEMKEWHLNTEFCIGCDGPVASVCLFSEVPMEDIETVVLDYQSRTSVALAKILLQDFWKKKVVFLPAREGFEEKITGTAAAVVIGDRALLQRSRSKYIYDLGQAWKEHTCLPFVFAAWVSNKVLPEKWLSTFGAANAVGLHHLDRVLAEITEDVFDLEAYFTRYLSYSLDEKKKESLQLFLQKLTGLI